MRVSGVAKTIVAGVFAVLSIIAPVLQGNDYLDPTTIIQMVLAILAVFGVYVVPNAGTTVTQPVTEVDPSLRQDPRV